MNFKDAPYLLTILFGALGYTFTTLSENLYSTPIIEYRITYSEDTVKYINCRITNVSRDKYYEQLYFELIHENKDVHFNRALLNSEFPYFMNHEEKSAKDVEVMGFNYYKFSIKSLVPFSTYKVRINYKGETLNDLRLIYDINKMREENFKIDEISIYLRKADLLSWIAKNQMEFSGILIIIWILCITSYLFYINKQN